MNKCERLKEELKKIGIYTETDLKEAIKKTKTDISLMTGRENTKKAKRVS